MIHLKKILDHSKNKVYKPYQFSERVFLVEEDY